MLGIYCFAVVNYFLINSIDFLYFHLYGSESLLCESYKDNFLIVTILVFASLAFDIVQQRNGYGEAQSAACRAGVCEAVLYFAE